MGDVPAGDLEPGEGGLFNDGFGDTRHCGRRPGKALNRQLFDPEGFFVVAGLPSERTIE
jgi:hypothetical protein